MDKKILNIMFDKLLHIWNKTTYWNPKMKPYIYGSVNWIHVINLIKTVEKLEQVKNELKVLSAEGKKILFVATKLQARYVFSKLASETGNYYVTEKWVPGLLTNFKTIRRRIGSYLKLIRDSETWTLDMLTKKEKATKLLELKKLDAAFKWLKEMKKVPEVIFVVDGIFEKQALKEARSLKLSSYAIFNTNWDESLVNKIIPSNTNSVRGFEFLTSQLKSVLSWTKITQEPSSGIKKLSDKKSRAKKEIKATNSKKNENIKKDTKEEIK